MERQFRVASAGCGTGVRFPGHCGNRTPVHCGARVFRKEAGRRGAWDGRYVAAMTTAFERAAGAVRPLDVGAMAEARARQDRLTKPRGALGRLETLSVHLAGIAGVCPPPLPGPAAVAVCAADHGVVAEGVTPWP